ncbi:phospholipase D family protein [Salipiger sp. P9]|uniref:phospholipase D family protein n=1 Tax=Salipiger pentaromativorans TaxID=2943193 RepID=UPI002157E898|nr:phospholipase D family protein [Salipiger pentaromativorans]MCR8550780.1 phospholipase D family protein [Salipiger pentaromativorans]
MALTPLITAAEGFPALERLAATARGELVMSFRILEPKTRLRSPDLTDRGLATWADLLAFVARKGVRLRLILSDFDPVFTSDLHRLAWASASGFTDAMRGDAQVLCAPHGQIAGPLWRLAMRRRIAENLRHLNAQKPTLLTPVQRALLSGPVRLRPVTLHQKFAVADGTRCIIGGLDVNERRFDTPAHDRPPEDTWHDVSMQVEDADFAAALRLHFAETWNSALSCGTRALSGTATPMDTRVRPQPPADLRLIRTVSAPCRGAARLAPRAQVRDHETALIAMIGAAERHLYIETQFLRHRPVVDALTRAAARRTDLQLVMVLPPAAERVLFNSDIGWDARHGHALQTDAVARLRHAYGNRLALISPGQTRPAKPGAPDILGAGPIYVHSKVILVDDRVGMVGSANLNGRSLRWDTEASVLFRRPADVQALRERLARKWLGPRLDVQSTVQARSWRQAALANAAKPPEEREGFALPYPVAKARRFSRFLPILPADMF